MNSLCYLKLNVKRKKEKEKEKEIERRSSVKRSGQERKRRGREEVIRRRCTMYRQSLLCFLSIRYSGVFPVSVATKKVGERDHLMIHKINNYLDSERKRRKKREEERRENNTIGRF